MKEAAPIPHPAEDAFAAIKRRWSVIGVCLFLAIITMAVFGRTLACNFIPYDDNAYVYENPEVSKGISLQGIRWAFVHAQVEHWAPLTTISHMLDCQFFDLRAGWHHLHNVLLHAMAAILLFLVLRLMTGALWRSAFVAAVFAVHPLHVESVAWVSERNDVLSGVYFMLTIGAYVCYIRKQRAFPWYWIALALFALGLMAKDTLVTLPFVLLLLDYWPLGRFAHTSRTDAQSTPSVPARFPARWRLVVEKVPFFALTAAACVIQVRVFASAVTIRKPSLQAQVSNALWSYASYIGQMFYPVGLAVSYPDPGNGIPAWKTMVALLLLASISAGAFAWRRKCPFLPVGWLWYLGMLVPPVAGFVQVGHAQSDRYTYLPGIGLYIMIAWGAAALTAAWPHRRMILGAASALAVAALAWLAAIQASYWSDGVTLWKHALTCAEDNGVAHNYLGYALQMEDQDVDAAAAEYRRAIALMPGYADAENNLGKALYLQGDVDNAILHFNLALQSEPGNVDARGNLAVALAQKGRFDEAIGQLKTIIRFKPGRPDAYNNLGNALLYEPKPDVDGAIAQFQKALDINPDYADAHSGLGNALLKNGEPRKALEEYRTALQIIRKAGRITPEYVDALLRLAQLLATCPDDSVRNGAEAVDLASQANEITNGNASRVLNVLAAAYAEAGRFDDAVETARRARELATADGDTKLANDLEARLALYRANTPLRLPIAQPPGH